MNISSPLVSVIMRVYNEEKYLSNSIDSILNQTYTNFELLIFNDGSTDNSSSIINSYHDDRIRIYNSSTNGGHVRNLNKGIKESKGKYIAILDSDDISSKYRLEKQVDFLEDNESITVLGTQVELIDENSKHIHFKMLPTSVKELQYYALFFCPFIHSSVMMVSDVVKNYIYQPDFLIGEDYYLWANILSKYKGANLECCLVKYRIHPNNYHKSDTNIAYKCLLQIYQLMLNDWKIPYTEEELLVHVSLSNSIDFIIDKKQLRKIQNWIHELEKHLPEEIDRLIFRRIIFRVWRELFWKIDKNKFSSYLTYVTSKYAGDYSIKRKIGIIREFSFPFAKWVNKLYNSITI